MTNKLLFVVTEDWYFVSHRLPLAVAALAAGYDVAVATRVQNHAAMIEAAGIRVVPFSLSRRVGNPLAEVLALVRLYRQEKPDLVHHVAIKPVLYGAAAARIASVPAWVNAIAGLGWMSSSNRGIFGLVRSMLRRILSHTVNQGRSLTIVQNPDDAALLQRAGVSDERLVLIRGAGVDIALFAPPAAPPAGRPVVVLASRMLWDKGPGEFVEAAKRLHASGVEARFVLVGDADASNPNSVPEQTLRSWHNEDGVEWWGHSADVAGCYQQSHVACLPTFYGEGIPKTLLEALACGLPVVTTDMPGCREVVENEVNGLLVPPRDVPALTEALRRLITDAPLRGAMGRQGRHRAEREFASSIIIEQTLSVYRTVLSAQSGPSRPPTPIDRDQSF